MSREYFRGIEELYENNAIARFDEVFKKLYVPCNFKKQLNSIELSLLLNDQLGEKGLMCSNLIMDGCGRVVEKNKHSQPIERMRGISKRLHEYLDQFHADEAAGII